MIRLFDHIPRDEVWFLPSHCIEPAPGESTQQWCERVVAEAKAGRVGIIRGLSDAPKETP